jgi:hypothetical protein
MIEKGCVKIEERVRRRRHGHGLRVFQFALVNVRLAGDTVASAVLELVSDIVIGPKGCVLSETVKASGVPASEVISPDVLLKVMPGMSLSLFVQLTRASWARAHWSRRSKSYTRRCRRRRRH